MIIVTDGNGMKRRSDRNGGEIHKLSQCVNWNAFRCWFLRFFVLLRLKLSFHFFKRFTFKLIYFVLSMGDL